MHSREFALIIGLFKALLPYILLGLLTTFLICKSNYEYPRKIDVEFFLLIIWAYFSPIIISLFMVKKWITRLLLCLIILSIAKGAMEIINTYPAIPYKLYWVLFLLFAPQYIVLLMIVGGNYLKSSSRIELN